MEDDDRPPVVIEALKHPVDEITVGQVTGRIGNRRGMEGGDFDFTRPPAPPPRLVKTGVGREPEEPGLESIGIPQASEVAPRPEKRVLDRVAGELRVSKDKTGGRIEASDFSVDERGEGVMVALPRTVHELTVIHARLDATTLAAVLQG